MRFLIEVWRRTAAGSMASYVELQEHVFMPKLRAALTSWKKVGICFLRSLYRIFESFRNGISHKSLYLIFETLRNGISQKSLYPIFNILRNWISHILFTFLKSSRHPAGIFKIKDSISQISRQPVSMTPNYVATSPEARRR